MCTRLGLPPQGKGIVYLTEARALGRSRPILAVCPRHR